MDILAGVLLSQIRILSRVVALSCVVERDREPQEAFWKIVIPSEMDPALGARTKVIRTTEGNLCDAVAGYVFL